MQRVLNACVLDEGLLLAPYADVQHFEDAVAGSSDAHAARVKSCFATIDEPEMQMELDTFAGWGYREFGAPRQHEPRKWRCLISVQAVGGTSADWRWRWQI